MHAVVPAVASSPVYRYIWALPVSIAPARQTYPVSDANFVFCKNK
jgi:hypothetical protein